MARSPAHTWFLRLVYTVRRWTYDVLFREGEFVLVYVAEKFRGQGAEKPLLNDLVTASEFAGVWTLQASIFVGNEASIAIHAACGVWSVGTRERVGCLYGRWLDTLW